MDQFLDANRPLLKTLFIITTVVVVLLYFNVTVPWLL